MGRSSIEIILITKILVDKEESKMITMGTENEPINMYCELQIKHEWRIGNASRQGCGPAR